MNEIANLGQSKLCSIEKQSTLWEIHTNSHSDTHTQKQQEKNPFLRGQPRTEAQSLASEILGDLRGASGRLQAPSIFSQVKFNFHLDTRKKILLLFLQFLRSGEADVWLPGEDPSPFWKLAAKIMHFIKSRLS